MALLRRQSQTSFKLARAIWLAALIATAASSPMIARAGTEEELHAIVSALPEQEKQKDTQENDGSSWFEPSVRNPVMAISKERHRVQLLDTGALALARLKKAIDSARHSIDLDYYCVNVCDVSTKYLWAAIQKKITDARREGREFRVRLLVDYHLMAWLSEGALARQIQLFNKYGIEMRVFNPSLFLALKQGTVFRMNQRSHQKRMIVDGEQLILGGRNLSDDYFGMNAYYNRIDKDIWVSGPVVKGVVDHFEFMWEHPLTYASVRTTPVPEGQKKYLAGMPACLKGETPTGFEQKLMEQAAADGVASPEVEVNDVTVVFDEPGTAGKLARAVTPMYRGLLDLAKSSVVIQNQYFIPRGPTAKAFKDLDKRGVFVEVITNSNVSGDAADVDYLTFITSLKFSDATQMVIRGFMGDLRGGERGQWIPGTEAKKWQIHAKSLVVDGIHSWIATNNIDGRSDNINLETGVLIGHSQEFAAIVERSSRVYNKGTVQLKNGPEVAPLIKSETMSRFRKLKSLFLIDIY